APDGQGGARHLRADAGSGPRDHVRPARRPGARPVAGRRRRGARRHRPDAVRLGTYGFRSTPVSGAAAVVAARKVRERARLVAAAMLEASADDLEWRDGKWRVRGDPDQALGIAELA